MQNERKQKKTQQNITKARNTKATKVKSQFRHLQRVIEPKGAKPAPGIVMRADKKVSLRTLWTGTELEKPFDKGLSTGLEV
eukprot:g81510.t1